MATLGVPVRPLQIGERAAAEARRSTIGCGNALNACTDIAGTFPEHDAGAFR
jgi:hypothetical protein